MSPRLASSANGTSPRRLGFNADVAAIGIALLLAALVRLNVVHHIGW